MTFPSASLRPRRAVLLDRCRKAIASYLTGRSPALLPEPFAFQEVGAPVSLANFIRTGRKMERDWKGGGRIAFLRFTGAEALNGSP